MIVASIFSFLSNSILTSLANAAATAVNDMLMVFTDFLNNSTAISLNDVGFIQLFDAIFGIGIIITVILAAIELAAAALQRNGVRVLKVPLNILLVVIGTTISVAIVQVLLNATDSLCVGLMQAVGFSSKGILGLGATFTALAATDPLVAILLGMALVFAVVAIVATMIVRKVLVVVAVVFAPLALAGATAQSTRRWVDRWVEMTLALIFSKLILVIIVITGFRLMEGMTSTNVASGITSIIGGIGLLVVASFSPVVAMKAISFTGGHFGEAAATGHAAASSVMKPAKIAASTLGGPASAAGGAAVGGAAAVGAGGAASSKYASAASRVLGKTNQALEKKPDVLGGKTHLYRPGENPGLDEARSAKRQPSTPAATNDEGAPAGTSDEGTSAFSGATGAALAHRSAPTSSGAAVPTEAVRSTAPAAESPSNAAALVAASQAAVNSPTAVGVSDAGPRPSSAPTSAPTGAEPGRARPSSPGAAPFLAPSTPVTTPTPRGRRPSPPGTPSVAPDQPRTDTP